MFIATKAMTFVLVHMDIFSQLYIHKMHIYYPYHVKKINNSDGSIYTFCKGNLTLAGTNGNITRYRITKLWLLPSGSTLGETIKYIAFMVKTYWLCHN